MSGPHTLLWRHIVLVALAVLAVACVPAREVAPPTQVPCAEEAAEFVAAARTALAVWDEAEAAARAADGAALGEAIGRLTALRADLSGLEAPECAASVKATISRYMSLTIDVHNAEYMNDCRLCAEETARQADAARQAAEDALAALQTAP